MSKRILAVGSVKSGRLKVVCNPNHVGTGRAAAHVGAPGIETLSPEAQAACVEEQQAMHDTIHFFEAELNRLRFGIAKPLCQMTEEQQEAILAERVGADFCEKPYLF
jgi:hypothetical protein